MEYLTLDHARGFGAIIAIALIAMFVVAVYVMCAVKNFYLYQSKASTEVTMNQKRYQALYQTTERLKLEVKTLKLTVANHTGRLNKIEDFMTDPVMEADAPYEVAVVKNGEVIGNYSTHDLGMSVADALDSLEPIGDEVPHTPEDPLALAASILNANKDKAR